MSYKYMQLAMDYIAKQPPIIAMTSTERIADALRWYAEELKQRFIIDEICPLCNRRFEKHPEADCND